MARPLEQGPRLSFRSLSRGSAGAAKLSRSLYSSNGWSLAQMAILKNVNAALDALAASASFGIEPRRILVTGGSFPFSPFNFPPAMKAWRGGKGIRFDLVIYVDTQSNQYPVHFA